jgi:Ca2+-binding EF-hand superfamily protein
MGPGMMGQGRGMGPGMGRNRPDFSAYDRNGDGKISEQEFQEGRNERIRERAQQGYPMRNIGNAPAFPNLDANGDGVVSPEEFSAHQSQRGPQRAR